MPRVLAPAVQGALCPHLSVLLQALPVGPLAGSPRRAQRLVGARQDGEAHLPAPGALLLLLQRRRPQGPRAAPGPRRRVLLLAGQDGDLVVAGPAAGESAPHLGAQPRTHRHGASGRRPVCADLGRFLRRCATGVAGGGHCPLPGAGRPREEAPRPGADGRGLAVPRLRTLALPPLWCGKPGAAAGARDWSLSAQRGQASADGAAQPHTAPGLLRPRRREGRRDPWKILPWHRTHCPGPRQLTLFPHQRKRPSSLDVP